MTTADWDWLLVLAVEFAGFGAALLLKRRWFRWGLSEWFALPRFVVRERVEVRVPVERIVYRERELPPVPDRGFYRAGLQQAQAAHQQLQNAGLNGLYPSNAMLGQLGNQTNALQSGLQNQLGQQAAANALAGLFSLRGLGGR